MWELFNDRFEHIKYVYSMYCLRFVYVSPKRGKEQKVWWRNFLFNPLNIIERYENDWHERLIAQEQSFPLLFTRILRCFTFRVQVQAPSNYMIKWRSGSTICLMIFSVKNTGLFGISSLNSESSSSGCSARKSAKSWPLIAFASVYLIS